MFVGREKELKRINDFLSHKGALMVYGLRRIGKTTLIKKPSRMKTLIMYILNAKKLMKKQMLISLLICLRNQSLLLMPPFPPF